MKEQEPLDRLERSSPGYGPGASPSTLERQSCGGRQTRRPPPCRRATRGLPARSARTAVLGGGTPSLDEGPPARDRSPLQGSDSNRPGPAHEAGWVPIPTLQETVGLSTRRESDPPRRRGRPVPNADRPRVHRERSAGIEPAPLTWRAS